MNEEIKKDIINVLKKAQPLIKKESSNQLKSLSNETLHNAGIYQDQESISISVIIFSLSKICNRPRLCNVPERNKFKDEMILELENAKNFIQANDIDGYHKIITKIFSNISKFETKFGMYISEVLNHARIKRGGRIYEHGFSIGSTAKLLGISNWDLLNYLGETKLGNLEKTYISTKDRVATARRIFSL